MPAMSKSRSSSWLVAVCIGLPGNALAAPSDAAVQGSAEAQRRAIAVATYDGGEVTVGELEDALAQASPRIRERTRGPAGLHELLEQTLRTELYQREAKRRGYGKHDRVRRVTLDTAIQFLLDAEVDRPLREFEPTDELLKQYFAEHKSEIDAPELRRVIEIVVATQAQARELLPQVRAAEGQALRELVMKHSIDSASRKDSGYSRYFDREGVLDDHSSSVDKGFARAAFALSGVGATSEVIPVDGKFAIIKLAAIRPAYLPSFEQALPVVRKRVIEARRTRQTNAIVERARKRLEPVYHYDVLDSLPAELPGPTTSTR